MSAQEYLAGYGLLGEFGRFRAMRPLTCRRGDRVVVRSHRGVEAAWVLLVATPGHAHFLPNTTLGQLLRPLEPKDEQAQARQQAEGQRLFECGVGLAGELGLPLALLDVEMLLDGEHAVLHHVRWGECDVRPLVSALSREFARIITLEDLSQSEASGVALAPRDHGCGRENCGRAAGGGCSSCGAGGGCGSCGAAKPEEVQTYFAGLREQMEQRRVTLL